VSAAIVPGTIPFDRARSHVIFAKLQRGVALRTDRSFLWLMVVQYLAGIIAAIWISPRAWEGMSSHLHPHVIAAIILGGIVISLPVALAGLYPGERSTRHAMAAGQMLMSGLLIHLCGGRIETHFHIFGSLAFLSFYRDWRVLVTASAVVAIDHLVRGVFFPESIYGVLAAPWWRSFEHIGWVLFEDGFLFISIGQSVREMFSIAERQAALEFSHAGVERTVAERTSELTAEIAERRQTEHSLRLSEQRFRQLAETIPGVFWIKSPDLRDLLYVSPGYEQIWGHSCESVYEEPESCGECIIAEDRAAAEIGAVKAARGEPYETEYRIIRPDGNVRWISSRGFPAFDEVGKLARVVGFATDVTERKSLELKLLEAGRLETVGRLAGGIAHDFNTILTEVIGHAELIKDAASSAATKYQSGVAIERSATRAARLTQQLLAFSRKQMLCVENLDLNEVVLGLEPMLRGLLRKGIALRTTVQTRLPRVQADATQIQHMLVQLALNAQDAIPREGTLTIQTASMTVEAGLAPGDDTLPGEYVTITVSDTGAGISEEVMPRLFEPFFTTKPHGQGPGLGLSMCYGVAKQLGGNVTVRSKLGAGATFTIYLPSRDGKGSIPPAEVVKWAPNQPDKYATRNILLVETNPTLRDLTATVLRKRGYVVHEATDESDALKIASSLYSIDLLVADEVMPGTTRADLAKQLQASNPDLRILVTSDKLRDFETVSAALSGLTILQKPYTPALLCSKVLAALGNH
jgi:PAS domain S-box-containing protein